MLHPSAQVLAWESNLHQEKTGSEAIKSKWWTGTKQQWVVLKWSHAQADLTSWYDELVREEQRKTPGLHPTTWREWRDLYTDNLFPEIMRLVYWLKVNLSMTIFTDHLWCIPFHDQCFQCNLLVRIITFHVWAWFPVRTGEIHESLLNVLTCLNLKSSFNHYQSSLSHWLITLQIELIHDLSSGLIPYITVCNSVTLGHLLYIAFQLCVASVIGPYDWSQAC